MEHKPYFVEVPGARVCVLMVHGFWGSPHHFDLLLPHIPTDWSVHAIQLVGHGGTLQEFAKARRKDWEAQVEREMARVCEQYERVVVVAHSMGCMLCANAAVKLGLQHKMAAMFFLQPALYPKCDPSFVCTALRFIYTKPGRDGPRTAAARACCGIYPHKRIWEYPTCIPTILDLFALARDTRKHIGQYDLHMISMQSYRDELVKRKSLKPFLENPRARGEFLRKSYHFYYPTEDAQRICTAFCETVEDVRKNLQKVPHVD